MSNLTTWFNTPDYHALYERGLLEIAQLRAELDGEKAAAMNYRADAIKAEKQRDDLLEVLEEAKEFIGKFPVQTSTLSSGHRLVSDPVPIMRFISEIDAAIASVKGGAA